MHSKPITSLPYLYTERLMLREYRREDFDLFAAHLADPISSAHLASADRSAAWRLFCSHAGQWLIQGAGWWAVQEKQTEQLVGHIGGFFREDSTVLELGWNTYRAFWGQGFAKEGAAAVLNHAFEVRGEPKVRALIASANESSLRVAKSLGLVYEAEAEIYGKAVGVYTLERGGCVV
jgi:RimJ/RimL family protein N-acetyltransferase